jgi:hypothetical protein
MAEDEDRHVCRVLENALLKLVRYALRTEFKRSQNLGGPKTGF